MRITVIFEIDGEKTEITFEEGKGFSKEWIAEKMEEVLDVFKKEEKL